MSEVIRCKVKEAEGLLMEELKFINSLSISCDDENLIDSVHDDYGNLLPMSDLISLVKLNEGLNFSYKGKVMDIQKSLDNVDYLKEVIRIFA